MEPFAPAVAVMVHLGPSPTTKSLNEVKPVAWVLVEVRMPVVGDDQPPEYFFTTKYAGMTPASTSVGAKPNVAAQLSKPTPLLTTFQ